MAKSQRKIKKTKSSVIRAVPKLDIAGSVVSKIKIQKPKIISKVTLRGTVGSLAIAFFIIWIAIGLFLAFLMAQGLRRGVFDNLIFGPPPVDQSQSQPSMPTEANLPGVGKVNVACVRTSLDQTAIQKIVDTRGTSSLTPDEKAKLEPCITQAEQASPSSSPSK